MASNGETNFYDVLRRFIPIQPSFKIVAKGTYQYVYTLLQEPNWNDSMLYTAFIQNYGYKRNSQNSVNPGIVFNNMKQVSKVINGKPDVVFGQNIFLSEEGNEFFRQPYRHHLISNCSKVFPSARLESLQSGQLHHIQQIHRCKRTDIRRDKLSHYGFFLIII